MRLSLRATPRTDTEPGLTARAHVVGRRDVVTGARGPRPGDVLVVDRTDLDRATAQAAVDAGVAAVLNTSSSISGRFPTLGAGMLADAGIVHVDRLGARLLDAVRHGQPVRVHDATVHAEDGEVGPGRLLDPSRVVELQGQARSSMSAHLDSLTLNAGDFLKREHRLLLHGSGLPDLRTAMAGRAVVVVGAGHEHRAELRAVRAFVKEQRPVVVAVGTGAVVASDVGMTPDVVVLGGPEAGTDTGSGRGLPPAAVLRRAHDVVVCRPRGTADDTDERLSRLGVTPAAVRTAAAPEDAALLLAHHRGASAIVGVGLHGTLEEMLDGDRPGLAGGYLTRLEIGPRLVDATALPGVYAGRVGVRHLLAVLLVGLVALLVAVLVTPVGQEWYAAAVDAVRGLAARLPGALPADRLADLLRALPGGTS
ncbi:putative cytokinetic ring protein SteA [Nocardioides lentus]|uniref:Cytokinetic ring protein SteA n=1 Tax=Nocardioides lentus TaxID=338077 RepID=A0ABP5AGG0_9ACTN